MSPEITCTLFYLLFILSWTSKGALWSWMVREKDFNLYKPWQKPGLLQWLRWQIICLQWRRPSFYPRVRKIPWRRRWQPTQEFLPGEFQGWRSLVGHSSQNCTESDMTEQLTHWPKPNLMWDWDALSAP